MAEIVLIHGIAQEQKTADLLEKDWTPALAGGIRVAGYPELADRITRNRIGAEAIDVRMAAYGDLFLTLGAMGSDADLDSLDPAQMAVAEALAGEWLKRAAERPQNLDHETAVLELGFLDPEHQTMGVRAEAGRALISAVTQLSWFALGAMAVAECVKKSLRQATLYMTVPALREQIRDRVLTHIGPETKVIIGHSLGSVIAYEIAATYLTAPLPLMLTLGSPLGVRSIIYDRLTPQPPAYPAQVHRWVNIVDLNDPIAAEPNLTGLFERNRPAHATLESDATVLNGAKPHEGQHYLGKMQVGRPIAEALSS